MADVSKCHHANGLDKARLDKVDGILVVLRMLGACAFSWEARVADLDASGAGREHVVKREEARGVVFKQEAPQPLPSTQTIMMRVMTPTRATADQRDSDSIF